MNTDNVVPLVVLAAETGIDVNKLVGEFVDAVVYDAAGVRCIPYERSREFIAAHKAAEQAEAERQAAENRRLAAQHDEEHRRLMQRIAALQARTPTGNALADMLASDTDTEERWEAAAIMRHEMAGGALTYHPTEREQT